MRERGEQSKNVKEQTIQTKRDFALMLSEAQKKTDGIVEATGWNLALSIKKQLDFMASCLGAGRRPTDDEAARINIGQLAIRNLEESDPQYADWLLELSYAFVDNWEQMGN